MAGEGDQRADDLAAPFRPPSCGRQTRAGRSPDQPPGGHVRVDPHLGERREEELAARGVPVVPIGEKDPGTIAAAWIDLFARAADYSPYELARSVEGLIEHLPAEEAARLIAARLDWVKQSEDAVHALAGGLAAVGVEEHKPLVRNWIENTSFRKKNVAPAIAAYVYGDIRPWADDLERKKDYAALAEIFNCTDYRVEFQLTGREAAARAILKKAGPEAVPAILGAMDTDKVGIDRLAALLLELKAREAVPELKKHLDAGRFAARPQLNSEMIKFVYGNFSVPAKLASIVAEAKSEAEKKEQVEGLLRTAGWFGAGQTVLYCDCGYPTRLRYSDGSVGPINPGLDGEARELYTTDFSCPKCRKPVATVTA